MWQLVTRPGWAIREFLEGKRIIYYKPITLILIIGGVYGLILYSYKISPTNQLGQMIYLLNDLIYVDALEFPGWLLESYAWIEVLLFVPLFTIASYWAFAQAGYSFLDHLILNTYLSGQRLLISTLAFPLLYSFQGSSYLLLVESFVNLIEVGFMMWAYLTFFKGYNNYKGVLLFLLTIALVFTQLLTIELIWYFFVGTAKIFISLG